ncbi:MAG: hypothetical protein EPN26_03810 [Rhodospirillales bacterium]|nr:MAG: hypothetical protein EPN26_03810 [Rhodospirillales bacterium]
MHHHGRRICWPSLAPDIFVVDTDRVLRFLEQRVLPEATTEARHLPIDGVEDFLAFEQLRRFRHASSEFRIHFDFGEKWVDDAVDEEILA